MMQAVEGILGAVEGLPAVRLDIDDDQRPAGVRVGAWLVARIDLRRGSVLVSAAAAERIPALRRRVNVERLAPRLRVVSP
jgi:hypothetical protein